MARKKLSPTPVTAAVAEHGSLRKAAVALGLPYTTARRRWLAERGLPEGGRPSNAARDARRAASRTAKAADPQPPDLAVALAYVAEAVSAQGRLLERLADREPRKPANDVGTPKPEKPARPDKPLVGGTLAEPEARERRATGRRYILTSAQNNTHVHEGFLASLQTMARLTGAEILISRFTYNKNAWNNGSRVTTGSADVWFAPETEPYLADGCLRLAPDLVFAAEIDRLPTAADPLARLASYTRSSSGVVGHAKVAMRSLAAMRGNPARRLYSTGTVTQMNYVDRFAGRLAAFHHVFGALYVEIDADGAWFARQINATDSGEFQDLDTVYTPTGTRKARLAAVVLGDIHRRHLEASIRTAVWGTGGMMDVLDPAVQVDHDVLHFLGRSHHSDRDPFLRAEFARSGDDSVEDEIRGDAAFLAETERPDCLTVVPEANHHTHLRRWLAEADFRMDPRNARYGHYLAWRYHQAIDAGKGADFNAYEFAVREAAGPDVLRRTRFLRCDESYEVAGVELGIHGDRGPNGARATPKSFVQLGTRTVTAHTHSAGIVEGVYTVGVSAALFQGYNTGPSSWSHTHCLVYENGKRALVTMVGDRWRGEPVASAKPRIRVKATTSGRIAA